MNYELNELRFIQLEFGPTVHTDKISGKKNNKIICDRNINKQMKKFFGKLDVYKRKEVRRNERFGVSRGQPLLVLLKIVKFDVYSPFSHQQNWQFFKDEVAVSPTIHLGKVFCAAKK